MGARGPLALVKVLPGSYPRHAQSFMAAMPGRALQVQNEGPDDRSLTMKSQLQPPRRPAFDETMGDEDAPPDVSLPDSGALVQHPDGWYWLGADGRQQFGPYATAEQARAEMHAAEDEGLEPGETLLEAEQELGIAEWVDPDTGEPAEATHTRLEDH